MALTELNLNPSKKDLKWFGLMMGLFFGVLGGLCWWKFSAPNAARTLWVIGTVSTAIYYAVPRIRWWVFAGWMVAAYPIGWVLSHVLLAGVYYLVVTPIGLIMRAVGRDPLQRKFDRDAKTYWVEHRTETDPSRYFRQF